MADIRLETDERLDYVNEKISLIQKKDGLTFGTDAFLLAAFINQQKKDYAVEFGAGTGIISLLLAARNKFSSIDAVEIQQDFYDVMVRNIALNNLDIKIKAYCCDVRDIHNTLTDREADVVFSNPPYMLMNSGKRNESDRKYIARHEVCGNIDDFCRAAFRKLKHGGKFYCVWRPDRLTSLMSALRANRLEPKRILFVHSDLNSEPSMVLVSSTKGGAEGARVLPPLFLYDAEANDNGSRVMTDTAKKIYETMSFED